MATIHRLKSAMPDDAIPEGRRLLLRNGYEPLILNGKAPVSTGWQDGPITPERLSQWEAENPHGGNTGLRCGKLAVADIDLWNAEHAAVVSEAICAVLGETLLRRVGQKGVALLFHNSEPISKVTVSGKVPGQNKATRLVEFLGIGQQLAAFGIHPGTGHGYDWESASLGDTPLDTSLNELPKVTPGMLREAASAAFNKLAEPGYSDLHISESGASRDGEQSAKVGEPVKVDMLESMLSHVDPACDRMTWIAIAGAIKGARVIDRVTGEDDDAFDGLGLFTRWSAGELNPDHAPGNFQGPGDCERTWASISATRRGGSSVGTLVFHARSGGYSGPSSIPAVERFYGKVTGQGVSGEGIPEGVTEGGNWFAPVATLNDRFAVVIGGKHAGRFMDLSNPRAPVFLDGTRFHLMFRDQKVTPPASEADANPKPVPVSKLWEAWRGRRTVTGIEFVPPGSSVKLPEGAHNLWQGFAVEPKEGEAHKPMLRHLYNHVCQRDGDIYRWLMAWLANLIQEPGRKPGVAITLEGEQGAGKTILYRYLEAIFGGHAASVDDPKLVVGSFNAHMAGLCLLGVEEGFWAGDRRAESKLKNLITAESVMMEQKGVDAIKIASHVHIMVTSNADWAVPVAVDDRRWAVFHVSPARRNDEEYWKPIYAALEGDGPANLLHHLLKLKYDRSILFRPPMTAAKARQAAQSMESVEQWWLDILRGDRDPVAGRFTSKEDEPRLDGIFEADTSKDTLHKDYLAWCDGSRRFKAVTSIHFWPKLRKLVGQGFKETRPSGEIRQRVAWFPPRDTCQEQFAARVGCRWSDLSD